MLLLLPRLGEFSEERKLFEGENAEALGVKHGLRHGGVHQHLESLAAVQLLEVAESGTVLAELRVRVRVRGHGVKDTGLCLEELDVFVSFFQKRCLVHFLVPRHQLLEIPRFLAKLLTPLPSQAALRDYRRRLQALPLRLRRAEGRELVLGEEV